jgi:hypothetical protein
MVSYCRRLLLNPSTISVHCVIAPSVNPLQNWETQHVNIVLQCMYQNFEWPIYQFNSSLISFHIGLEFKPNMKGFQTLSNSSLPIFQIEW